MSLVLPPGALEALVQLRTALSSLRIVLIGASALKTHLPLERPTGDIDLLFLMDTEDPLPLLAPLGWRRDPRIKHRYHRGNVMADILPVSEAALVRGYVELEPGFRMNVMGCELALTSYQTFALSAEVTLDVATLPALLVMKVASYLDRPQRSKDLEDLSFMLAHALGDDDEVRWDAAHPINHQVRDFDAQGACYLGFGVAEIATDEHRALIARLWALLEDEGSAAFADMVRKAGLVDQEARLSARIAAFREGLGLR